MQQTVSRWKVHKILAFRTTPLKSSRTRSPVPKIHPHKNHHSPIYQFIKTEEYCPLCLPLLHFFLCSANRFHIICQFINRWRQSHLFLIGLLLIDNVPSPINKDATQLFSCNNNIVSCIHIGVGRTITSAPYLQLNQPGCSNKPCKFAHVNNTLLW